jgi:hypothetical protein
MEYTDEQLEEVLAKCGTIKKSQKGTPILFQMPSVAGVVDIATYEYCYRVYYNNQIYYSKYPDVNAINQLEQTMLAIIPPCKGDKKIWFAEQSKRLSSGINTFCREDLKKYIKPISRVDLIELLN